MAESDMAAPVSGEPKKGRKGIGAVLDRKDDEIARLRAELEAERAAKAAPAQTTSTGHSVPTMTLDVDTATFAAPPPVPSPSLPVGYDEANDPLSWITDEMDQVYIISRTSHFLKRRHYDDQLGKQAKEYFTSDRDVHWESNPFEPKSFRSRNEEENYKANNFRMHLHEIRQEQAREMFEGREPMPQRAIIRVEDYEGQDHNGRVKGKKSPASKVALREAVRNILQNNPASAWFWTDWPEYINHPKISMSRPNPYGKGIDDESTTPVIQGFSKD